MANLNSVVLIGRITRDIEVQRTQSGVPFARFSLAVDRPVSQAQQQNQQNGQQAQAQSQSQVDFIPVTVWNKQAENVAQYCGKGSLISVTGSLRTYKYQDKTNPDISHTGFEVRAANVQFLVSKRPGGAPNANANAGYGNNANANVGNTNNGNGYAAYGNNNYAGNANNNAGGYNGANTGYAGGNGANGNSYNGGGYGGNAGYAGGNGDSAGYAGGYDSPVDDGDPFGNIQF